MKQSTYFFAILFLFLTSTSFTNLPDGYEVGDVVNDFKLKNVDGKNLSMADDKTVKGYIIVFTCNTCPVAKAYEQRIIALHDKYKSAGYPVIAINPNDAVRSPGDSFEGMQERAKEKGYTFPYLMDETQEITKSFGAKSTPTTYIVSKKGADFILAYKGAIDNDMHGDNISSKFVEDAMAEIVGGKAVSKSSTKAFGCGIKWSKK